MMESLRSAYFGTQIVTELNGEDYAIHIYSELDKFGTFVTFRVFFLKRNYSVFFSAIFLSK